MNNQGVPLKKITLTALICSGLMSCASTAKVATTTKTTVTGRHVAAEQTIADSVDGFKVELQDVASLLKGYFSFKKADKTNDIKGYSAYVLNATGDNDYGRVVIYLDDPNNMGKQMLIVSNDKFLSTGGPMEGDEPSLATNRRDSLLIQSGNDGFGRTAWHETVTVAYRGGQLVVAGYDFDDYDKLGEDPTKNCSVNFLTGKGVLTMTPGESHPGKAKLTKLTVSTQPVLLKDWTVAMRPAGCGLN